MNKRRIKVHLFDILTRSNDIIILFCVINMKIKSDNDRKNIVVICEI